MRAFLDALRAARWIEVGLLLVALALLGLWLMNGATPAGREAASTDLERRLGHLLEQIDGAGRVSVMIAEDDRGAATGAVIVASGLDSVKTSLDIQSAAKALLDIDLDRICVIGKWGGEDG